MQRYFYRLHFAPKILLCSVLYLKKIYVYIIVRCALRSHSIILHFVQDVSKYTHAFSASITARLTLYKLLQVLEKEK